MAYALVGTIGAVSQGAAGAAVTPAWGTGENCTAGNLLICWVVVDGSATIATQPTGWSTAITGAGTSTSVAIFYKIATGTDAAPTIAAISSGVIAVQLGEFSGNASSSPLDSTGSNSGITTPVVSTNAAADAISGELIVATNSAFYSKSATKTLTQTLNNATVVSVTSASTSTANHYAFGYGISTANATADSDSFAFTTFKITGVAGAVASFKLPPIAPTVTTSAVTSVSYTSAIGNGNITSTGGVNPTVRGICYMVGTSGDPTIANSVVSESGSFSTGAYTESLTGLTANTSYVARAYATNSAGTAYGSVVQFTTLAGVKVWNGSSWVYKPLKVWNGSSWATKSIKVWDGSGWVTKG